MVYDLKTLPQLARELNTRKYRIEYLVESRNIQPSGRIGNARVYDSAAVEYIRSLLRRMGTCRL